MKKLRISALALAALGASVIVLAPPALAGAATLRTSDLDLTSEAGKAELSRRIEAAVDQACPAEAITGSRISNQGARAECMAEARKQIQAHVSKLSKRTG